MVEMIEKNRVSGKLAGSQIQKEWAVRHPTNQLDSPLIVRNRKNTGQMNIRNSTQERSFSISQIPEDSRALEFKNNKIKEGR